MQKYKVYWLYIPLGVTWKEQRWLTTNHSIATIEAMEKANTMASEGWELVSASPRIEGYAYGGEGCSYTKGIDLFFKRPIE